MDKLCRTQASYEVFEQVNREVWPNLPASLLGAAKLELIMTDPESVLTTGIDVSGPTAREKTTESCCSLSGGERSLTSIALVFAIRKIKPTPFCRAR